MATKTSVEQDPLTVLLAMPLEQRIIAVGEDVQSRTDRFSGIGEFDLADALEVPQPEMPTSDDWSFTVGTCISLRTPYDERDGRFRDLSRCITDDS